MSHRSTATRRQPSSGSSANAQAATVAITDPKPCAAPSLESLLKSCGALQSVIRQKSEDAEPSELDPHADGGIESDGAVDSPCSVEQEERVAGSNDELCEVSARNMQEEAIESASDPSEQRRVASVLPEMAGSLNIASILKLMREESRASIEELKASQAAAAAGQSAVLKALFEVVSRSFSMRENSGDGVGQKLIDFEERLLQRISHMTNSTAEIARTEVKQPPSVTPSTPAAAKKSGSRSWEEIRNDLLLHGDSRETQGETDIREAHDIATLAAIEKTAAAEAARILDVPGVVDPDSLSDTELRQVFLEREEFISTLISRLRQSHQQSSGHPPAEKLKAMDEHLPEDLATQVSQTLEQLDELARIGELELSLERARLSRQVSKLEDSRRLLEHHARQLGLTLTDDCTVSNPKKLVNRDTSSRRWLSKLGFGQ